MKKPYLSKAKVDWELEHNTCPHGFVVKKGEGYPKKCPFCKDQAEIFKRL